MHKRDAIAFAGANEWDKLTVVSKKEGVTDLV